MTKISFWVPAFLFAFSPFLNGAYGQNLGIGTANPLTKLHIYSPGNAFLTIDNGSATSQSGISFSSSGTGMTGIVYDPSATWGTYGGLVLNNAPTNAPNIILNPYSGYVGIGTANPSQALQVAGTTMTTKLQVTSGAASGYILQSDANGNATWVNPSSVTTAASVSNASNTNTLTTTVNGVTGSGVNIINSNVLSLSGTSITSTINGSVSNSLNLSSIDNNIYNTDGSLTGNRNVTMGTDNLTFSSTTGKLIFNPTSTGNVAIGNSSPNAQAILDLTNTSNYALVMPQIATTSAPSAPTKGMTFYNSTTNCLQYWNGSAWINVTTVGASSTAPPTWVTDPSVVCISQNVNYVFNSVNGASYLVTFTGTGNTVNSTNATVTPLTLTASAATTTLTINAVTSGTLTISLDVCPGNAQITQTITAGYGTNIMDVNSQNVTSLTTTAANEIIFIDYETYNSNTVSTPPTVNGSTTGVTNFWTSGQGCNTSQQHYDWYYLAANTGTYTLGDAGNLSSHWAIGNVAVKNTYGCPLSASNIHYGPTTGGNNSGWDVSNCGNWTNITTNSVLPVGAFLCAATGDDGSSCGSGEANCSPQSGFAIYQAECDGDGNNETIGGVTITSAAAQTLEISNTSQKNAGWQMILWWVQYP